MGYQSLKLLSFWEKLSSCTKWVRLGFSWDCGKKHYCIYFLRMSKFKSLASGLATTFLLSSTVFVSRLLILYPVTLHHQTWWLSPDPGTCSDIYQLALDHFVGRILAKHRDTNVSPFLVFALTLLRSTVHSVAQPRLVFKKPMNIDITHFLNSWTILIGSSTVLNCRRLSKHNGINAL